MTLKTSLIIAGDSRGAQAAVDGLATSVDRATASTGRMTPEAGKLDKALDGVAASARNAAFQLSDLSTQSEAEARAQARAAQGALVLNKNIGLQRAGWTSLGQQVQDVGIQYSMNTRLSQILAQQSGQLFGAINMIAQASENSSGKLGKFAGIMAGPWGIAATLAISLGSALWATLSQVDESSQGAEKSTIDFSSSLVAQQGIVANSTDGIKQLDEATKGLINTQAILLDNLQAVSKASVGQLEGQLATLDQQIATLSKRAPAVNLNPVADWVWSKIPGNDPSISAQLETLKTQRAETLSFLASARGSLTDSRVGLEERNAVERADPAAKARGDIERERARLRERRRFTLNQESGSTPLADAPGLEYLSAADFDRQMAELTRRENALKEKSRKPKKDNSAAKATREAERLTQFGERAEDAIARLNDQFNQAPRDIDQARQATDKLDGIIADLEKRKPANFEKLIAQAQAIKPLIQDSLQRPIREMLEDQERQIAQGALLVSGRKSEADALQLTYSLMDKLGAESEAQLATELAKRGVTGDQVRQLYGNLDVLREQTREMQKQQAVQQAFLGAIGDQRENIRLTIEALRKDGPKALGDFAKRSMDVLDRLFSEVAAEKLFGGIFRELEDQVTGADKVSDAGEKMAAAVEAASKDIDKATDHITALGDAAAIATARMKGEAVPSAATGAIADAAGFADITVTATKINPLKELKSGFKEGYEEVFTDLKKGLKDIFSDIFGDRGLFNESLGKTLGRVAANGQLGAMAGGLTGNGTGGAIGGIIGGELGKEFLGKALGSFAGPLGSIAGGLLGGIVGGLFKPKPKYGGAVVTGGGADDVSVSGNAGSRTRAASGLASAMQDQLAAIAEEFNAEVGTFRTAIGVYDDKYRVNTEGRGGKMDFKGNSAIGLHSFGDDQGAAIAFAALDAIQDGGLKGLSKAVQQAFASSDDLDKALEEALKVREIETLLGGIGAQMETEFRTFERQAKERVEIASKYGFDVVAIEKKNAEDRAKLVDQILADRVGSLQQMLDDIKFGDLFEGSLADQRQAILAEIAKARTAADAGEEGAADKLAGLSRQLIELSRDAYGTAGAEYAADRSGVISASEAVIQKENERIRAAQEAATQSNAALQEISANSTQTNELLSGMLQEIKLFGKTVTVPTGVQAAFVGRGS